MHVPDIWRTLTYADGFRRIGWTCGIDLRNGRPDLPLGLEEDYAYSSTEHPDMRVPYA
jgi:hypothetical protein